MRDHLPSFEIPTKHKEMIRQLYGFVKILIKDLMDRYKLGESSMRRILKYDAPERARPIRTARWHLLDDT
jgi:hypothetical protein